MTTIGFCGGQASSVIGSWKVQIKFSNGETRALRIDARGAGKGSFLPLIPRPLQSEPNEPSNATWTQDDEHSVSFSGPVRFPLGNVGVERGTLVLKGKLGAEGGLAGEAMFFPTGQDPADPKAAPSKTGSFTATRITAE